MSIKTQLNTNTLNPRTFQLSDIEAVEGEGSRSRLLKMFIELLLKKPEFSCYNSFFRGFQHEDVVEITWTHKDGTDRKPVTLNRSGKLWGSFSHRPIHFESDLTIEQICKLIAVNGANDDLKMSYKRIDIEYWLKRASKNINSKQTIHFYYSEVKDEILRAARTLSPKYETMNIEQIGDHLMRVELQHQYHERY